MQSNDKTIEYLEGFLENELASFGGNLQELIVAYKKNSKRLDTILKQNDRQQLQLLKANEELDIYKNNLLLFLGDHLSHHHQKGKFVHFHILLDKEVNFRH